MLCGLVLLLACLSVSYAESDKKEILATVGTYKITLKDLKDRIEKFPPGYEEIFQTEEGKEQFLREIVRIEVFSREARSTGLHRDKNFEARISEMTKALLAAEYIKKNILSRVKVSEEEAKKFYEEHLNEFKDPEKIKAPSIFIKVPPEASPGVVKEKEEKAREILERLKEGEDFSKLSEEFSEETIKAEADYFARGRLVPEIENDVFGLKIGEISPILKVQGGLLIFKLEDRIPERILPYEEAKEQIIEQLRREKEIKEFEAIEKRLFSKYKVIFKMQTNPTASMEEETDMTGKITNISPADLRAKELGSIGTVLIEGKGKNGVDKASVRITTGTTIFKLYGKDRQTATFNDLRVGQKVQAKFKGPVMQSYPVQAEAEELVILQND